MDRFEESDRRLLARRVRRCRESLRDAGLRPVQLWVPDTRKAGFAAECQRQCVIANQKLATRRPRRRRWIKLQRGDLVTWSLRRAPRPPGLPGWPDWPEHGMVIQHDLFISHEQIAIVPVVRSFSGKPDNAPFLNVTICDGLQAKVDQLRVISRRSVKGVYGRVDAKSRLAVDRALALFLGIAR